MSCCPGSRKVATDGTDEPEVQVKLSTHALYHLSSRPRKASQILNKPCSKECGFPAPAPEQFLIQDFPNSKMNAHFLNAIHHTAKLGLRNCGF